MQNNDVRVRMLRTHNDRRVRRQVNREFVLSPSHARRLVAANAAEIVAPTPTPAPGAVLTRGPGHPVNKYSRIVRAWQGQTAVILGGGPSLRPEDVARCRGAARVVAVNNAYLLAPWADVLYFADARWHGWHAPRAEFQAFAGQLATQENTQLPEKDARVHCLHIGRDRGLSDRADTINTGSNSGFQAVNLCYLAGARRIILLGFDMQPVDGRTHWHADHPVRTPPRVYQMLMLPRFKSAVPQLNAAGVDVVNATPGSALDCFRRDTLENALKAD